MTKLYLRSFTLISEYLEIEFIKNLKDTCYNGVWPYKLFPDKGLREIEFAPVTIFYGGNGSGKTTLLNIMAEKLGLLRQSPFSGGPLLGRYIENCKYDISGIPHGSRILTSDDVTDYLMDMRRLNDGIDARRDSIFDEYLMRRGGADPEPNNLRSLADYDEWKATCDARSKKVSRSQFVRDRLMGNVDMYSNGETAMRYYVERMNENALYFLDEPENSMSASLQLELRQYLADSARFFGCQLVISTHSPFFLSIPGARIYDLDSSPVEVRKWTELENVRVYHDFFKEHESEFN